MTSKQRKQQVRKRLEQQRKAVLKYKKEEQSRLRFSSQPKKTKNVTVITAKKPKTAVKVPKPRTNDLKYSGYRVPREKKGETNIEYLKRFEKLNADKLKNKSKKDLERIENRIQAQQEISSKPMTIRQSLVKTIQHTTEFKSMNDVFKENCVSGMKKYGVYEKFVEAITKPDGTINLDSKKFVYKGDGTYEYDSRVIISFKNSPASVSIYVLDNLEYDKETA